MHNANAHANAIQSMIYTVMYFIVTVPLYSTETVLHLFQLMMLQLSRRIRLEMQCYKDLCHA